MFRSFPTCFAAVAPRLAALAALAPAALALSLSAAAEPVPDAAEPDPDASLAEPTPGFVPFSPNSTPQSKPDPVWPGVGTAADAALRERSFTDARWGLGFDLGGGGYLGLTAQVIFPQGNYLDLGLHLRVAITPGDAPDLAAPALTATYLHEFGAQRARFAIFSTLGATTPAAYRDAFFAAGPALRIWTPKQRVTNTLSFGPGFLFARDIPGANPGPPFLLLARYAVHFQRAAHGGL